MRVRRLVGLIVANLATQRLRAALTILGIVVGTALLVFFIGLGQGLRERVLNRIFPVNQLELEPRAVQVFGIEQIASDVPLDDARIAQVARLPGVVRAFGKQKSGFPARLWGGKELIGYNLFTEAFFDGMPAVVLRSELDTIEDVAAKRREAAARTAARCDVDLDCLAGQGCRDGTCELVVWASRFRDDLAIVLPCAASADCAQGVGCHGGRCGSGHSALPAEAAARCLLPESAGNGRGLEFDREVGVLARPCDAQGDFCPIAGSACPAGTYCAGDDPDTVLGWCEPPLPAVLNPLLIEVFNSDMARSLGAAPLASLHALYGIRFHVAFGDSYFAKDAARDRQQVKQAVVVGFSRKAPELGVALPLSLVRALNARFRSQAAAQVYDAVLIETLSNERVPEVVAGAEKLGFQLSRKSRAARTVGTVVFVTALALILLAFVVLLVAAAQIAQTFALLVHERRREIAVLRALGATRGAVAFLVLGEAAVLGVSGGTLGVALARAAAAGVDLAARAALAGVPLLPDGFFAFPVWAAPLGVAVGIVFCVAGALGPARRAAQMDPAEVLAQG
ncbi:MAG: ABC transporter permease [Myxococcales bacterium]|nr:ABC transporter permease [Myxococcales bacterium]